MRKLLFVCLVFFFTVALAGDDCDTRATLAGSMVPTKHSVREDLRTRPVSGPMGDLWRYLAFLSAEEYQKLGDSDKEIEHTAKLIAENDVSSDWRIELLVYNEFFRAVCEAKLNVLDIHSVDARALNSCFGDVPPSRKDFSVCIRSQVSKISEQASGR